MSDKIFEVECGPEGELVLHFKPVFLRLSEPTKQHFLGAQREFLLALRSMLDTAIEGTEECQRRAESKTRTKIDVE